MGLAPHLVRSITMLSILLIGISNLMLVLVSGHGNMIHPPVWFDRGGKRNGIGCKVLDLPETEWETENGERATCLDFWYSNQVTTQEGPTLTGDVTQPEVTCHGHENPHNNWFAPGTAPVFGPCGTMGGNPYGCPKGNGTEEFGDICNPGGGFAMGKNAEQYDWPGQIPVTEWLAGSEQEVIWHVDANHAGGYSYRLCKISHDRIQDVTEKCFQEMPLNFVGDDQWVVYKKDYHSGHRTKVDARRTTEGTYPPGSMWTANPILPYQEEGGSRDTGHGDIIDKVEVPAALEAGEYVLSFRWDCKCTPQVWTVCSNILVL